MEVLGRNEDQLRRREGPASPFAFVSSAAPNPLADRTPWYLLEQEPLHQEHS